MRDPTGPEVCVRIAAPAIINLCPECGERVPPGMIRHPECFRAKEAQRLIDAAGPAESARRKSEGAAA